MKSLSFIFILVLLFFGGYFLVEYFQTCYTCDPALASKTLADKFENPVIILAIANFAFAVTSAYLMTKRKFGISASVSGIAAGLQIVAMGTLLVLNV